MRSCKVLALTSLLALCPALAVGCSLDTNIDSGESNITDVPHTAVERQSIGNCWLYAQASWVESLNLAATGQPFDVSQSYWTYWHWYDQLVSGWGWNEEIETGGGQSKSNEIVLDRGLVPEGQFVPEDTENEMSYRQDSALNKMNQEMSSGRLTTRESRKDKKLVRQVLDDAWGLSDEVRAYLDQLFGEDGTKTLQDADASTEGTPVIAAEDFPVRYTERVTDPDNPTVKDTNLAVAIDEWERESYPSYSHWGTLEQDRRDFIIRAQRALHDAQPVVITWQVDFNAMESADEQLRGSFNMTTLGNAGRPGSQGGHMTVLEDYEAVTEDFGLLKAGETLDPEDPDYQAKLDALLERSTEVRFLRIKNSWGAFRDDRSSAPGFPGYHDLYMDYLNGPIQWCPSEKSPTAENCTGRTTPLRSVMLPPGYGQPNGGWYW